MNAAKLLALCDAGLVDASFLAGRWSDALHDADVVIDCVLPPPGLVEGELAADLMERGLVAKAAGRRGVSVAPDATCLTSDGTPIGGLAALGRLTEDVVIGNDTLSRWHPSAARWAATWSPPAAPASWSGSGDDRSAGRRAGTSAAGRSARALDVGAAGRRRRLHGHSWIGSAHPST